MTKQIAKVVEFSMVIITEVKYHSSDSILLNKFQGLKHLPS